MLFKINSKPIITIVNTPNPFSKGALFINFFSILKYKILNNKGLGICEALKAKQNPLVDIFNVMIILLLS